MPHRPTEPASLGNREKILRTSIDLFAQKGFGTVTTREIAAAVGIKAASIYNHFPSKEAILDEIVSMFCVGLRERVHPAFDASEAVDVKRFLDGVTHANDVFFSEPLNALVGVILIVGGLTYFPALALGPIVEKGTPEQREKYMRGCCPAQPGEDRKVYRGAFALTEIRPRPVMYAARIPFVP